MILSETLNYINVFVQKWPPADVPCKICSQINISTQTNVPFFSKQFEPIFAIYADKILICSRCGQFYHLTSWLSSPDWGEAMEGLTEPYEVDCLYKRNKSEIMAFLTKKCDEAANKIEIVNLKSSPKKKNAVSDALFNCPKCKSHNVNIIIKNEFYNYTCMDCGYYDNLDDWQKDEWKSV